MNPDFLVIGAGIAGLYAAYSLKKRGRGSVCVLEAAPELGGRARMHRIGGVDVPTGAGIGIMHNKLLLALAKDLDVPVYPYRAQFSYADTLTDPEFSAAAAIKKLRAAPAPPKGATFKKFAKSVLGAKDYKRFVENMGYTDFEDADAADTLANYGLEDDAAPFDGFGINWADTVNALAKYIGRAHIMCNAKVTRLDPKGMCVTLEDGMQVCAKKAIIVATDAPALHSLFPARLYKDVQGQPFLRAYAQVAKASRPLFQERVPTTLVVPAPVQKIIPINPSKGVYMIAYSDNESAEVVRKMGESRERLARAVEQALGAAAGTVKFTRVSSHYWPNGTHYLQPGAKQVSQKPYKDAQVYVVGEAVADHRGWVEGALESVEKIIASV